jgi:hypothetical protein
MTKAATPEESAFPRRPKTPGPYRGEFGAIHHEGHPGFLFTVAPVQFAPDVADALNVVARLEAEALASKIPAQRFDTLTFHARETVATPSGWTIARSDAKPGEVPALYVGGGVGNPDVFASHVAGCLNLNAAYTAALLPVARLLLDLSKPAEVRRALWAELRRIVAHYDAVSGKEHSE